VHTGSAVEADGPVDRRPSPWQAADQDLQADATRIKAAESLALDQRVNEPLASADAAKCTPSTDAGLTPQQRLSVSSIMPLSDDRLFTVAEISALLDVRRSDVYAACDAGHLQYVKFEGAVQVEGRDLKCWVLGSRR
jgi:hypothetical protein